VNLDGVHEVALWQDAPHECWLWQCGACAPVESIEGENATFAEAVLEGQRHATRVVFFARPQAASTALR